MRYGKPPSLLASSARALVRRGSGAGALPDVVAELPDVAIHPAHLARYAEVCGFPAAGPLPPTYPHVLAFPLALALMTRRDFPYRPLGLVHVTNRITSHRALAATERLSVRVRLEGPRPHPRGTAFTVATTVSAGGEPAWEEASTYLRRERHPAGAPATGPEPEPEPPEEIETEETWRLPADTGRRYAAASGDRNPIHLYPCTSRPFGFRRPIAHGMWTAARSLAALGGRLPAAATVEVAFRAPVALPGTVRFAAGGRAFAVTSADGARAHLYGLVG